MGPGAAAANEATALSRGPVDPASPASRDDTREVPEDPLPADAASTMRIDLHVHSTASDGTCSPEEVVNRAAGGGLDVLALSDHDTVSGVARAIRAARSRRLHVIPAVELSSTWRGQDIHILGYFIDVRSDALTDYERRGLERRSSRMAEMMDRLARQGVAIRWEQLEAQRPTPATALTRPHLARALVETGYAVSVQEAFTTLIGNGCPAYVPTEVAAPETAIQVIRVAGGIPVWAHPPANLLDDLLSVLVDAGLGGVEVYRPAFGQSYVSALLALAEREGLLVTGGSDWHGPEGGAELGDFFVDGPDVAAFLAEGGI